jgi:DNA-binding XRE family transcriptional regulator
MAPKMDDHLTAQTRVDRRTVAGRGAKPIGVEATLGQLRESRGLSQLALGKKLRIRPQSVCKVERGAEVRLSTLRRFVKALGGTPGRPPSKPQES